MRLIDADECEKYFYEHLTDDAMVGAINAINEMPTIEPEADEFAEEMRSASVIHDEEIAHIHMDDAMCELLEKLGYEKAVKIFKDTEKWYS